MTASIVLVDLVGLLFATIGFCMAFRQRAVRRLFGLDGHSTAQTNADSDPLTYILRISGVMVMVFAIVIAGMITLFHLN